MIFAVLAALLAVLAFGFVVYPFLRPQKSVNTLESNSENVAIYRQNVAELDELVMANEIDVAEFRARKQELDVLLVSDYDQTPRIATGAYLKPRWGVVLAVVVLLSGGLVYRQLGALEAVELSADYQALMQQQEPSEIALADLLARISNYASGTENAGSWWYLAANGYAQRGDYAAAAEAYQAAAQQWPDDPRIWAEQGQALYLAANRQVTPQALRALQRAVALDPHQATAQGVLGIAAFEQGDFAAAIQAWQQALKSLPAQSPQAQTLNAGISQARIALGQEPKAPVAGLTTPAAGEIRIPLTVRLAPQITARPDQVVYVFAKAVSGPPMPLAVERLQAGQLPADLVLDESDAMAQGMGIGSQTEVEVVARLSLSGNPIAQAGDWQSAPVILPTSSTGQATVLLIDEAIQ